MSCDAVLDFAALRMHGGVMDTPAQPPEAALIERKLKAIRPKLSVRQAAMRAEISEGRWRQIVKGFQAVTSDVRAPVVAPAETLARMARAVGITPKELTDAGRPDAAKELARIGGLPGVRVRTGAGALTDAELVAEIARRLDLARQAGLSGSAEPSASRGSASSVSDRTGRMLIGAEEDFEDDPVIDPDAMGLAADHRPVGGQGEMRRREEREADRLMKDGPPPPWMDRPADPKDNRGEG